MAFWNILEDLCRERGITPQNKGFLAFIQIKSPTVTEWKQKGIYPKVQTLILISEYFDTSIDYLTERTPVKRFSQFSEQGSLASKLVQCFSQCDEDGQDKILALAMRESARTEEERKKEAERAVAELKSS